MGIGSLFDRSCVCCVVTLEIHRHTPHQPPTLPTTPLPQYLERRQERGGLRLPGLRVLPRHRGGLRARQDLVRQCAIRRCANRPMHRWGDGRLPSDRALTDPPTHPQPIAERHKQAGVLGGVRLHQPPRLLRRLHHLLVRACVRPSACQSVSPCACLYIRHHDSIAEMDGRLLRRETPPTQTLNPRPLTYLNPPIYPNTHTTGCPSTTSSSSPR